MWTIIFRMIAPGPTLETARLILRPTATEDFEPLCKMMADAETARFIGGVMPPSAVWFHFCSLAGAWAIHGHSLFSVIEKSTNRWIGRIGPWVSPGWPGTEIAWGLLRDAWGHGYAAEGAAAAITWAFDHLGWTEIIHCIEPANHASIRLAERLGSRRRGPGRMPPPYDAIEIDIWGQTRDEWRAR
jgi:RimJ/RimL family protein N-acetyltransferase